MKTVALILAFAVAAPLAGHAAPANTQQTLAQKVASTYHTAFPAN